MARRPGIGRSVEGVHAVAAAAANRRIRTLYVEDGRRRHAIIQAIVEEARAGGAEIEFVSSVLDRATTDAPQGVVADARPIPGYTIDDLCQVDAPALLVLDHVEDPHNLGAIARSAVAAGMTGLIASARRAAPFEATAFKAAAGALERLPVGVVGSVAAALERIAKHGLWSVGLTADGTDSLFDLPVLGQPVAVVVGAEGHGLSPLVAERCDVLASIPMASGESLNASVAAAIGCYEVMRVRSTT